MRLRDVLIVFWCRAQALRGERLHLLLVLDRLLVQVGLMGRLLSREAWIVGLAGGDVEWLLELLAPAGAALSLMIRQVDRIVAPEVLPGLGPLDHFVNAAEQVVS